MFELFSKGLEEELKEELLKSEHFLTFQTTLVKLVHDWNAPPPILVTLFGISMLVKLSQP